jgi:hypothetical protein
MALLDYIRRKEPALCLVVFDTAQAAAREAYALYAGLAPGIGPRLNTSTQVLDFPGGNQTAIMFRGADLLDGDSLRGLRFDYIGIAGPIDKGVRDFLYTLRLPDCEWVG